MRSRAETTRSCTRSRNRAFGWSVLVVRAHFLDSMSTRTESSVFRARINPATLSSCGEGNGEGRSTVRFFYYETNCASPAQDAYRLGARG